MATGFTWDDFSVGFWHPFGPHAGETPEQILARKANEVSKNGWTLWSFASRSNDPEPELIRWTDAIRAEGPARVFAFCSNSVTTNRNEKVRNATRNRWVQGHLRQVTGVLALTNGSRYPHLLRCRAHFGTNDYALVFIVKQIHFAHSLAKQPPVMIEWLDKSGAWRSERLDGGAYYPTHGEYLLRLRSDSPAKLRPVRALLELNPPYVAAIRR